MTQANGSPRKNGKTASLVKAFTEGAEAAGNSVSEIYVDGMNIASCKACEACSHNGGFCLQKDEMEKVNEDYLWADVIVFASPMYWGTITGQLKTVIDLLYAIQNHLGYGNVIGHMETAFIMTARGGYYQPALDFYSVFTDVMRWKNWGTVLGAGKEAEAYRMGAGIK